MLSTSSSVNTSTMTIKQRHQDCDFNDQHNHQEDEFEQQQLHSDHRRHHSDHRRHHKGLFYNGLNNNWLWTAVLLGLLIVSVSAKEEKSLKPSPASTLSSSLSPRDEIYIDDEGLEGSGRGGLHDDLEKDHDFSGSGFGPDDEDSDSDYHHHSHTHTDRNKNHPKQQSQGKDTLGSSTTSTSTSTTTINSKVHPKPHHHQHTTDDDEDFDLDGDIEDKEDIDHGHGGPLLHGSGDGGFIDGGDDEDGDDDHDDDHDGDHDDDHDDDDNTGGILGNTDDFNEKRKTINNNLGAIKPNNEDRRKTIVEDPEDMDEDDFGEIDSNIEGTHHHSIDGQGKPTEDDQEGDYDTSKGGNEDEDDDSPIYTDITDPSGSETGTGSGSDSSSSSSSPASTDTTTITDQRPGGINTQGGTNLHEFDTNSINSLPPETKIIEQTTGNEVLIMNANDDDRTASFFAQPGILAAVIGGAVVGLLCAILVVMFIVYRMRKKDEGSYALDEPKRSPAMNSYAKNATNREFYA